MEQNQINHELNGYKFSFNRINPYLKHTQPQSKHNAIAKSGHKAIQFELQPNQYPQSYKVIKNKPSKDRNNPSLNAVIQTNAFLKNTKQMFYQKPSAHGQNKTLIDLYLRKTRFNNINKLIPTQNNSIKPIALNQTSNNPNPKHNQHKHLHHTSIYSPMIDTSILTQTKQPHYDQNQEDNYYRDQHNETEKQILLPQIDTNHEKQNQQQIPIIVTSKPLIPLKISQQAPHFQQTILPHHSPKTQINLSVNLQESGNKKRTHNSNQKKSKPTTTANFKIIRNFSEHKFSPYLSSSPKNKANKSETGPIVVEARNDKVKSLLKLYPSTSDVMNPMLTIEASSSNKPSKHPNLKIKTEHCQQPHQHLNSSNSQDLQTNLISLNSPQNSNLLNRQNTTKKHQLQPLKLENLKVGNQQLTSRKNLGLMGQIKYKSPRMILSSRNQLFKGRNEGTKMKLFTEEEEGKIIKEFYSLEKGQESREGGQ